MAAQLPKTSCPEDVRQNWPVIVIEGSGRLYANEVAALKKQPSQIEEPTLAEIVEEGDLRIFPITGALEDFERAALFAVSQCLDCCTMPGSGSRLTM